MSDVSLGVGGLLQYNSTFRVLICLECEYAIQKSAIESHLLKHKIYRRDRHDLLSQIAALNLLEPDDVTQPSRGSAPIEALPIFTGFRCTETGCDHLTISEKRIKRHWSEAHGLGDTLPPSSFFTCQVKLQTFFRGTKVRYFEVTPPTASATHDSRDDRHSTPCTTSERQSEASCHKLDTLQKRNEFRPSTTNHASNGDNLDLATITYFHHFTTVTAQTLPGPARYWQECVVQHALRHGWLMYGLLALAACHLTSLANDLLSEQMHQERHACFTAHFATGMEREVSGMEIETESTTAAMAVQIQSLLKLSHLTMANAALSSNSDTFSQAFDVVPTMRACIVPSPLAQTYRQEFSQELLDGVDLSGQNMIVSHGGNDNKTPQQLLDHLNTLPSRMVNSLEKPDSALAVIATISAIVTISDCCLISFASDTMEVAWEGATAWLTKTSDYFDGMLGRNDTAALVVLAHWAAVLVRRAERLGCWIVKGLARVVVLNVVSQLSASSPAALCLVEELAANV